MRQFDLCKKGELRYAWWQEMALGDFPKEQMGIWRLLGYYLIKEQNPDWFDPPVEKGTSMANAFGVDDVYHRDMSQKQDVAMPLSEYQEKLMKTSKQWQQIAMKWELSPEHPGLWVAPSLDNIEPTRPSVLGQAYRSIPWPNFGPRFFDRPLNEGCLEKGLAALKYGMLAGWFGATMEVQNGTVTLWPKHEMFRAGAYLKYCLKFSRNIMVISFLWGSSLCMVADLRKRDDRYNHDAVALICGVTYYALTKNLHRAWPLTFALYAGGNVWHNMRASPGGFWLKTNNNYSGRKPLLWQYTEMGGNHEKKIY